MFFLQHLLAASIVRNQELVPYVLDNVGKILTTRDKIQNPINHTKRPALHVKKIDPQT
jgi:hypothetical protein